MTRIPFRNNPKTASTKASSLILNSIRHHAFSPHCAKLNITVKLDIVFIGTTKNFQLFKSAERAVEPKNPENNSLITFTPAK